MFKSKKIIVQIFAISIFLFLFSYNFLTIFFVNLNWEFLYFLKNFSKEFVNKNLIVVEIDDLSYNKLWFPLDRWDYVPFLDNLKEAQTAVIWIDILFVDKWKDEEKDKSLSQKFRELWNIVLGFDIKNSKDIIMPYFLESIKHTGYFKPIINIQTNKVYSLKPVSYLNYKWKNDYYESFSFWVLREYFNYLYKKEDNLISNNISKDSYEFFWKKIPLKNWSFFINYNDTNNFLRESFYNIYTWNFDKTKFKDKIVLVWYTAEWVKDDFFIPWIKKEWWILKWVYVHANTINNILNENYVIFFDNFLEKIIWFLFITFIIYLNVFYLKTANLKWISLWVVFLFIFIFLLYLIIFFIYIKNFWIYLIPNYPFEFISILFLSFFVSSIFKYITEDKNKILLSKALWEYVSIDIVSEILNSTWNINLSWENKCITIFFSDIAWFTTISEKLSPEKLVSFLREYLWVMSNIIMDNKWFINKYEWDAIMALWWIFWEVNNYWVKEACKSALLQQSKLNILNNIWKSNWKDEIQVRMWIHTWNAIIWNIWSEWRKMEYTALWDSVNLASRLEWVNKFYNTNICVSEDVVNNTWDEFVFRYLDKIRVKWKNIWINIYELMNFWDQISDLQLEIKDKFEKAITIYLKRDFKKAFEIFNYLENIWDKTSSVYKYRCNMYLINPPQEDWDWVWVLDEK